METKQYSIRQDDIETVKHALRVYQRDIVEELSFEQDDIQYSQRCNELIDELYRIKRLQNHILV